MSHKRDIKEESLISKVTIEIGPDKEGYIFKETLVRCNDCKRMTKTPLWEDVCFKCFIKDSPSVDGSV